MTVVTDPSDSDFARVQAIFFKIIEAPPQNRAALIADACAGNESLRAKVLALLAAHETRAALPAGQDQTAAPPSATAGEMIDGRFKLLEEIGAGGMGVVWMAEQRVPVRRLVAIKLIKTGMDSRQVLARFEAERQALAMMDHPNIARVFDGGVTELGRPYFVMELVRGLPVTQYCDQRRMNVRDRLAVFTQICQAVQHAHQKGVIHRDIKPSNVLVTEHDGTPVPKVIDFGLAKALGGAGMLTDHTLHTAFGTMAGTPLYAAPEQVAINAIDVDTRADIYALGVMLYELLTGSLPLERERLQRAGWEEMCRVIREEDPPRPSLRIQTSALLPSLAASRQIDAAKLSGLVKGDLDWIVLKALDKERSRRYDTAAGFAADISRHLKDEPVTAAPPTLNYRTRKFIRKHRTGTIGTAAVGLMVIAGLIATTWQWNRAENNAVAALKNQKIAEAQTKVAETARAAAEHESYIANIGLARSAMEDTNWSEVRSRLDACPQDVRGFEWRLLHERALGVVDSFAADDAWHLIVSPDHKHLLRIGRDGLPLLYDKNEDPIGSYWDYGPEIIKSAQFSRDGSCVLLSSDSLQRVVDLNGKPLGKPFRANSPDLAFSPDGKLVLVGHLPGGDFNYYTASLVDRNGQQVGDSFRADEASDGTAGEFSPDGKTILNVVDSGAALWDLSGKSVCEITSSVGGSSQAHFNQDGKRILTVASAKKGFNSAETTKSIAQLWTPQGAKVGLPFVLFSSDKDGAVIPESIGATWGEDGHTVVTTMLDSYEWRDESGKLLGPPVHHDPATYWHCISPDGQHALFRLDDAHIALFDRHVHQLRVFEHYGDGGDARFVSNQMILLHGERDCVSLIDLDGNIHGMAAFGNSVVNIDDDTAILTCSGSDDSRPMYPALVLHLSRFDQPVKLFSPNEWKAHPPLPLLPSDATAIMLEKGSDHLTLHHPDGTQITVSSQDGPIVAAALLPKSNRLITVVDSKVHIWDATDGSELVEIDSNETVVSIAVTADETRLILNDASGDVEVWDTRPYEARIADYKH
jgi:serine/threonine protein kinase/WD40 repeat protein